MNNIELTNEEAVIEALTLTCEIDKLGDKKYYNKEGKLHRIHGPAIIWADGDEWWFKNGLLHREDGPAKEFKVTGHEQYWVNGEKFISKKQFIQWQIKNGIKPIE